MKDGLIGKTVTLWSLSPFGSSKRLSALCAMEVLKKKLHSHFVLLDFTIHMTPFPNLNGGNHQSVNFLFTQRIFGFISENVKKNVRRHL